MSELYFDEKRRRFLVGAGSAALSLPFLRAFPGALASKASAQSSGRVRRLVVIMHPQGFERDRLGSGNASSLELGEILQPLAEFRDQITLMTGVDNEARRSVFAANGHNAAGRTLFTATPFASMMNANGTVQSRSAQGGSSDHSGRAYGPSFDQVFASHLGGATPIDTLALRVGGVSVGENELFFSGSPGSVSPVTADHDPAVAFTRLAGLADTGGSEGDALVSVLRQNRPALLGSLDSSIKRLRKELPHEDRELLELHQSFVERLSERYSQGGGGEACEPATLRGGYDASLHENEYLTAPDHIENIVMAFACDLTRVASIQFTQYHKPTFPWLGQNIPGGWANYHDLVHAKAPNDVPKRVAIQRYYAEQVALLMRRLSETRGAGGGSLLDETMILWATEFSDASVHLTNGIPMILAGAGIPGGRQLDLSGHNTSQLYATLLTLLGRETDQFGLARAHDGAAISSERINGIG